MCFHSHPAAFPSSKRQISLCHLFSLPHLPRFCWRLILCVYIPYSSPLSSLDCGFPPLFISCCVSFFTFFPNTKEFCNHELSQRSNAAQLKVNNPFCYFSENKLLLSVKPKDHCAEVCYMIIEVDAYVSLSKWKCRQRHECICFIFISGRTPSVDKCFYNFFLTCFYWQAICQNVKLVFNMNSWQNSH